MCQMVNSDMEKFKECKEDREGWVEGTFLNRLIRKDFTVKVTFQQTPGGDEGESMWIPGGKECSRQN